VPVPIDLTRAERDLLPTAADVEAYRTRGWFLSPPLFTADELEEAVAASERFYRGQRDRTLEPKPAKNAYWEPSHGDIQRHNDYIVYESDMLRRIFCKPLLAAYAARLMGRLQVRLWSSTLIYKPARAEESSNIVPWHTDRHHWQTCTSDELITAFVPLHDCGAEQGSLTVLDGSHRWEDLPPQPGDDPTSHFADRPASAMQAAVEAIALHNQAQVLPVSLAYTAGQVSFHHCRTYHSSGPNTGAAPRRVITVRFQEQSNAWRPAYTPAGAPVVYSHDERVRKDAQGRPDYADPDICPVLWEESDPASAVQVRA
jgi:hypothetical protein